MFYGESPLLMYRKDVPDAQGITIPEKPSWQQVADIAAACRDTKLRCWLAGPVGPR